MTETKFQKFTPADYDKIWRALTISMENRDRFGGFSLSLDWPCIAALYARFPAEQPPHGIEMSRLEVSSLAFLILTLEGNVETIPTGMCEEELERLSNALYARCDAMPESRPGWRM